MKAIKSIKKLFDIDKTALTVRLVSDFSCPWCYVAHKKLVNSAEKYKLMTDGKVTF